MADRIDTQRMFDRYRGAAPIVRKLASDPELRDDLRALVMSGQRISAKLMKEAGRTKSSRRLSERQISEQVDHLMNALAAGRVRLSAAEPTHWRRWAVLAGMVGGAIAVIFMPKTGTAVRARISSMMGRGETQPEMQAGEWAA